jgi:hypothetical protein
MLVLEEAGGCITDYAGASLDDVDMGLDRRVSMIAAADRETLDVALEALRGVAPLTKTGES